jgi:hypothetical protein
MNVIGKKILVVREENRRGVVVAAAVGNMGH